MASNRWINLSRKMLWVDCTAGAVVGMVVLLFVGQLSEWFGLPQRLVFFMGVTNLVYACYSFFLVTRRKRPKTLIRLLIAANLAWSLLLLYWITVFAETARPLGVAYLLLEALFVGGLAVLEWRSEEQLRRA